MARIRNILAFAFAASALTACNQPVEETTERAAPPQPNVVEDDSEAPDANADLREAQDNGAPAGDFAVIERACRAMPDASDALCACLQEQARALSADELGLAAAQIEGDEAKAAAHRENLDIMGLSRGGGFIMNAPYAC